MESQFRQLATADIPKPQESNANEHENLILEEGHPHQHEQSTGTPTQHQDFRMPSGVGDGAPEILDRAQKALEQDHEIRKAVAYYDICDTSSTAFQYDMDLQGKRKF